MPVLVSETIAYTPLELSDVSSAVHQPSHKSRDPTSREAIWVGQSSFGSGKQWAKFSQFCTELCHLNPKPTLCISKALQNLMKAYLFISVPNSCLHWRGEKKIKETKWGMNVRLPITETIPSHNSSQTQDYQVIRISAQVSHWPQMHKLPNPEHYFILLDLNRWYSRIWTEKIKGDMCKVGFRDKKTSPYSLRNTEGDTDPAIPPP